MKLIGVTDDQHSVPELLLKLQQTEPYIDAFILREKSKSDEQLTELIMCLAAVHFPLDKLILHANPHVANKLSISKVQLTGYGLSVRSAQSSYPALSFGCSVHSLVEAKEAEMAGADWLLYGHLYETASKQGQTPRGTKELFAITASCQVPVYAIGGIQPHHVPDLQQNNVSGTAILSPLRQEDAAHAVKRYRDAMNEKGVILNEYND
ncbi:thiamine phosphate synthase [Sporosarcina obsidiansis]|uniref:thiamine phosphate synthase n=1 Tax=Sporosarcina obsidiansis TaxID=2660748 RepID=UPI00129BD88D|nr:thiamine phosphate synthase [Sporosarcina obsidiansis]